MDKQLKKNIFTDISKRANNNTLSFHELPEDIQLSIDRKRDELNGKSIIHQWGIVPGPLPLFGQTTNEHII
ncbi:unnamed protein product [Rotaria socialis]